MLRASAASVSLFALSNAFVKEDIALVSGDFDTSKRGSPHSDEFVKATVQGKEYVCEADETVERGCMLPSYTTCFLTSSGDGTGCGFLYNGSKDISFGGTCSARCFHMPANGEQYEWEAWNTPADLGKGTDASTYPIAQYDSITWMGLISGPFLTNLRSKEYMQKKTAKDNGLGEYECESSSQDSKRKCMLPSFGTCFLTQVSEGAACQVEMNDSRDTYMVVKGGSCRVRCLMVNTWSGMWVNEVQPISSMLAHYGEFSVEPRTDRFNELGIVAPSYGMAGYAAPHGLRYECLPNPNENNGEKKCFLPSGTICFLEYVLETSNCDIVDNGGDNPYLHAAGDNCAAHCYTLEFNYESGVGRRLLATMHA